MCSIMIIIMYTPMYNKYVIVENHSFVQYKCRRLIANILTALSCMHFLVVVMHFLFVFTLVMCVLKHHPVKNSYRVVDNNNNIIIVLVYTEEWKHQTLPHTSFMRKVVTS